MLHHFNHSRLTAQLEQAQEWGMEGREGWFVVDMTQADGEISAEVKEIKGADGRLRGETKAEGLEGKKSHALSQQD